MKISKIMFGCGILLGLSACGGGGDGSSHSASKVETGVFVDSYVSGLKYQTETREGTTGNEGDFTFLRGEEVTFFIGDTVFPAVAGKSVITPLDIFGTTDVNDIRVVNMARLLQSLDADGNPDNGIAILPEAQTYALGLVLDFSSPTFESDVSDLVANSGSVTTALIDADAAIAHLQKYLNYSLVHLEGTWYSVGLKTPQLGTSSDQDFGYDVDSLLVDDEGNTTLTQTATSNGMPGDTETFALAISEAGLVSGTDGYTYMNGGKSVMVSMNVLSGDESAQQMSVMVKKATSYAVTDLEGTWYSVGLKTPQLGTSSDQDYGYDVDSLVINDEGNTTLTQIATSNGMPGEPEMFALGISDSGVVSGGGYVYMNADKDVMIAFDLLSGDESAQQMSVLVKKAASYSVSDLEGTWYAVGMKTPQLGTSSAQDYGYDVDSLVIDDEGHTILTQTASSNLPLGTETFTLAISETGVVSGTDGYTYMNAGKNVMVSLNVLSGDESAQQMTVFVKKH